MKPFFTKAKLETKLLAVFVLFVLFFTFMRYHIGEVAAWMLSMTNEVTLSNGSAEFDLNGIGFEKNKYGANKTNANKTKQVSDRGTPVTVDLPKTETPIVLMSDDFPSWNDKIFSNFPSLRCADGKTWNTEKTVLRVTTDGRKLYLLVRFFDKFPDKAVRENAELAAVWQDDSIEIFLMKDQKSEFYCQYIVSVSGIGCLLYLKTTSQPHSGSRVTKPEGFAYWGYDVEEFDNRFDMEITIPLSNIGIDRLTTNDSFLMQIVRNYRGQKEKKSVTLHLFPTHIYADSRFGISNHDRRAFQAPKVMNADVYSTLDKTDGNFLKGMNTE